MVNEKKKYLIVGNGKLAFHLKRYFTMLEIDFINWNRRSNTEADLFNLAVKADVILFAISDSAIEKVISYNLNYFTGKLLIHFSGALVTDLAYGVHPLMTFSDKPYNSEFYKRILFVLDENAPEFEDIFPLLKNPNIKIPLKFKEKYHALCVMANNFTTILWQKFFSEMNSKLNIDEKAFFPFLEKTFENICKDHKNCLTGPLARNDQVTIDKNIDSLKDDLFQEVYKAFVNIYKKRI